MTAFTLVELLVTIAVIGILASLLLPALGSAKKSAKGIKCRGNLHQLAIAMSIYIEENRQFPGSTWVEIDDGRNNYYVWPERLLASSGGNRALFHCPASAANAVWDSVRNKTLGATVVRGQPDPWRISSRSRFSIAYNDWGIGQGSLNVPETPQLGLGGDVSGPFTKGVVFEASVRNPSHMIMLGDGTADASWDASLDPTQPDQWPSNRHGRKSTNIQFVDGHSETVPRRLVIDPSTANPWRRRWNNDDELHEEIRWILDDTSEAKVSP